MDVKEYRGYGVSFITYFCQKGEGLPWHGHPKGVTHGHVVIVGSTKLEIEDESEQIRTPNEANIELPPDKKHAITALEDGTIFTNMIRNEFAYAENDPNAVPPPPHKNRVLMADGTIVEAD